LEDGSLTYGDIVLDGRLDKEVFFSSYICHPSLANNELSGPLLQTLIYKYVSGLQNRRYTYRFLLAPETIGSIVYLDTYGEHFKANMLAGFILTCSGLDTHFTYKRSRKRNSYTDRLVERVLSRNQCAQKVGFEIRDFYPYGSDERQYCSPGFDLPVGSIMRGVPGEYPEYHTSADNKALLSFPALLDAFELYKEIIDEIESDRFYRSNNPCCEPRLGKHGLYPNTGGEGHDHDIHALNWVLNLSDGQHSIRDIIDISNLPTVTIEKSISKLVDAELIYLNGT
jgi:aminopeptidase-like protein